MSEKIRPIAKVRLKWVKNRGLDHVIDRDTDIKAAVLLKDTILTTTARMRTPTTSVSSRFLSPLQKTLGLTVPVLRFLRRYPTLFSESPDPRYPSVPTFSLAPGALLLHRREEDVHLERRKDAAERLARLLMMCKSKCIPIRSIMPLRYDLGLPHDFLTTLVPEFPDLFTVARKNGFFSLELGKWEEEFAVSELQRMNEKAVVEPESRGFVRAGKGFRSGGLVFPMSFPRGYGAMKKVKAWMEEFDRLPYISPYEDVSRIHPESEIMEKHVVAVLHELLSLTIHKKTKRNYLRCLREELNLPQKFTRVFTRYPGIFYLSLKCKMTTVALREGYRRGKLVDPHLLALIRYKYYYVMRTGVLYRGKAAERLLALADHEMEKEKLEEKGEESEDEEFSEGTASEDGDTDSDEV